MAATPVAPLTVAQVALVANQSVKGSVKQFPGATFKVRNCHKTSARYGECDFYVVGHFRTGSTHLLKCSGQLQVRNIGQGIEHRFLVKGCKPV